MLLLLDNHEWLWRVGLIVGVSMLCTHNVMCGHMVGPQLLFLVFVTSGRSNH